jgi:peroxiredoxin Q/BCP
MNISIRAFKQVSAQPCLCAPLSTNRGSSMKLTRRLIGLIAAVIFVLAVGITGSNLKAQDQTAPTVGSQAPDFKLPSQEGSTVNLHDFKGKWVVLYFYPKDMTQGCTIEAHNFQRDLALYEKKDAVILGVSVDAVDSHKEFCTKEGLTFKLLADTGHDVSTKYGTLQNYKMQDGSSMAADARTTFLISPDGKIAKVFLKVNPTKHSEEVLAALAELQHTPAME